MLPGGRVCLWGACMLPRGGVSASRGACMLPRGGGGLGGVHGIRQDTVNERAVRILLECILVGNKNTKWQFMVLICVHFIPFDLVWCCRVYMCPFIPLYLSSIFVWFRSLPCGKVNGIMEYNTKTNYLTCYKFFWSSLIKDNDKWYSILQKTRKHSGRMSTTRSLPYEGHPDRDPQTETPLGERHPPWTETPTSL